MVPHIRLVVAGSFLALVTACGGGGGSSTPTSPTASTPSAPPPVTVTYSLEVSRPSAAQLEGEPAHQLLRSRVRGSIQITNASATVSQSCSALPSGGGSIINLANLTLTNTTISENQALPIDQTILFPVPFPGLVNSTLRCNLTGIDSRGGAISIVRELTLTNNEIAPFTGTCVPAPDTMCVLNNRFQITVDWATSENPPRIIAGEVVTDQRFNDGGWWWMTNRNSNELFVQMINRCANNDRFWVFFSSGTTVKFDVVILDTMKGIAKSYTNPLGVRTNAITDTSAFATCP